MKIKERTTRIWITKLVTVMSIVVALFVLAFGMFSKNSNTVYGLSQEVSTQEGLLNALSSSEYDEIIVTNSITLTNGTILDGDQDDDGNRKIIRAKVTGTTDQGVINSNASNYSLFYVSNGATVHINNCIIKGGSTSAIVNGANSNSTASNNSTLYVDNCQISNSGSSTAIGGGIRNTSGCKIVLTNSSIYRNVAKYGGGFQNQQGTFIMDNCSVSENRSLPNNCGGGGGENTGNNGGNGTNAYMYIYNSTIANNTSQEIGGGINNCKNGYLYIINSTIAGNATTNGTTSGGGIGNHDGSTVKCVNSILLDNVYLSNTTTQDQDVYAYNSGNISLEGCVYGSVTGSTTALANSINVDESCYQTSDDDSVFAATKTGSIIKTDGSQGASTYDQVALVTDENGVTYAPISADSKATSSNPNLTPVKVEFDYSNLSNVVFNTGADCSESVSAPTIVGGGTALKSSERIVTVTVFVNQEFDIAGGTVYGDSYIIDETGSTNITLSATPKANNTNKTVLWALANQTNKTLKIVSTSNPYTIDTSVNSTLMQESWNESKNSYDIVLQPITMTLEGEVSGENASLSWNTSWSNTYCSSYTLSNSISSYDVYYALVGDIYSSSTTLIINIEEESINLQGLSAGQTYYFFIVPKLSDDEEIANQVGYVSLVGEESGEKTYVLATSLEDGEEYLIVSSNTGTARALTTNNSNSGTTTDVSVQEENGTPYIKQEVTDSMIWTATKSNSNWILNSGSYYVYLNNSAWNRRLLNTSSRNLTVTFAGDKASISYNNNYYLSLAGTTPSMSSSQTYVYFYKLKTKASDPTGITAHMQSIIGEDSGSITGLSTSMEHSTDGLSWTSCTSDTMTNVPVGTYYFRYKESITAYASSPVKVEVKEKKITNISIKNGPKLSYTALDNLDLSSMVLTIIYNDNTTTDVTYSNFTSDSSSVYQRSNGHITTSMSSGDVLSCSHNGKKITVELDGFSTTTLALTVDHNLEHHLSKSATCEEDGNLEYYICKDCDKVFDKNNALTTLSNVTIARIGHNYGTPTYEWNSDNTKVTATVVCGNDSNHVITETVDTIESITVAATCLDKGIKTYTATFTNNLFTPQTKNEDIDALDHDYDYENAIWTWHNNYYVTLLVKCKNDESHTQTLTANVSNEVTKEATCVEEGIRTYTASITIYGIEYKDTKEEKIDPKGHNYSYPTYEWSEDGNVCTATTICLNDSNHVISETVNAIGTITTAPTCTAPGLMTYTATFSDSRFETQSITKSIPALDHNYDYENGSWTWSGVYYVTYTVSCINDNTHQESIKADITDEVTKEPTCTEEGIRTYTATVTVDGKTYTSTKIESIEPKGHSYGTPTFTWSSDYSTCTATIVCINDETHIIEETVQSIQSIDVYPTCTEKGRGLFTAEFNSSYFYTQVKYTDIPALGHDYVISYTWNGTSKVTATAACSHDSTHVITETVDVTTNIIDPTCEETGLITYTALFTNSLFETQTKSEIIDALGHDYVVTYTWDGTSKVTATAVCSHDSTHVITEMVDTEATITLAPTCLEEGIKTYTATFANSLFETQTKNEEISALGHKADRIERENEVLPTCDIAGSYEEVVYCSVCGEEISRTFVEVNPLGHDYGKVVYQWSSDNSKVTATITCSHDSTHVITETVTTSYKTTTPATCTTEGIKTYTAIFTNSLFAPQTKNEEISALGHKGEVSKIENMVDATCHSNGSYDVVVYCSVCGDELSRETLSIPMLEHSFGEVTYTWNSDNSKVTAKMVCSLCNDIEIEEVLTTSEMIEPTCENNGLIIYTAKFNNEAFMLQTKEVKLEALGHKYEEITYEWNNDNTKVTAKAVCKNDNSHIITETVDVVTNTINPTCEEEGLITYTATFVNSLFEAQTKSETIEALGHNYGEVTYTWSSDNTKVVAKRTCSRCNDEEIEEGVVSCVIKNATCQSSGLITYTVTFINQAFEAQTKIEVIEALGHSYGMPTYSWSTDNKTVTAMVICEHDSTHVITEVVQTTSETTLSPTCENTGIRLYTAEFVNSYFELQTKEEVINALGHNYLHYDLVPANCLHDGMMEYYYCTNCNKYYDKNYNEVSYESLIIKALGHDYDYDNGTWIWSNDYTTATYKVTCGNDSSHFVNYSANIESKVTTNPTCNSSGVKTFTASIEVNGNVYTSQKTLSISALGHNYDYENAIWTWNDDYASVTVSFVCENDANHKDNYPATISSSITKEATCTSSGIRTYTAKLSLNGITYIDTKEEIIDVIPHTYTHFDKVNATCDSEGLEAHYYCSVCDKYFDEDYNEVLYLDLIINPLGHNYDYENGIWIWSNDYSSAVYEVSCINDNNHKLSLNGSVVSVTESEATHTETGKIKHTATYTINEVTYTNSIIEELPRLHHEVSIKINRKEPTCEEDGNILYYYCENCKKYYIDSSMTIEIELEETIIQKLGHNYIYHEHIDTTCEKDGMEAYYTCSVCGKVFDSNKNETTLDTLVIEALGHNYIYHEHVDATCEKDGMEAYYTCSVCGKVFDLNKSETTLDTLVIEALGHDYHEVVTLPTCENQGYTTHTCQVCNDSYIDNYVDALGHDYHEVVTLPTCENQGYTTHTCQVCNDSYIDNYVDALGHEYKISYEWNQDNSKVTAKARCIRCGNEIVEEVNTKSLVISLATCLDSGSLKFIATFENSSFSYQEKVVTIPAKGHDLVHHDGKDATCTIDGYKPYDSCECGYTTYEIIPKLGHTPSEKVVENKVLPTCENNGSYDEVVYCSRCGEELDRTTIIIPKLGHSYSEVTYNFSSDHLSCIATRTCLICGHIEEEIAIVSVDKVDATCLSNGTIVYTATFTNEDFLTQTFTEDIPALGHNYQITYTWSNDNRYVTATAICSFDTAHKIIEEASTTSITINATCEDDGYITYKAAFSNSIFEEVTKKITINKLSHIEGDAVRENEVLPTCEDNGSYDLVVYCSRCGIEISRETIIVNKLSHIEGETVRENEVLPTCETPGSYDLVVYCNRCGDEISREKVIVPKLDHSLIHHDAIAPTCLMDGNYEYYSCDICGKLFDENKNETTLSDLIIPKLGHNATTIVKENEILATCEALGSYELVTYCKICGDEISRELVIVPMISHDYDNITYTWNSDNTKVTASMVCKTCGKIVEETVDTTSNIISPSCLVSGKIIYEAVFENVMFEKQSKEVAIPALGHSYKSNVISPTCLDQGYTIHTCERCGHTYIDNYTNALGHKYDTYEWVWDNDYQNAKVIFTCGNDNSHKEIVYATITETLISATCESDGSYTYLASLEFEGNTYKDMKVVPITKLSHIEGDIVIENNILPTCDSIGSYDEVIYCERCGKELSRKTIEVEALGHDYDYENGVWSFETDFSKAYYTVYCKHDNSHRLVFNADIEKQIIIPQTHNSVGEALYSFTVEILGETYLKEIKEELPMLHHETSIVVQAKAPTCEENGNILYYYCVECNKYFSDSAMTNEISYQDIIILALNHTYIHHDKVDATCENPGIFEHYTCSNCGEYFNVNKEKVSYDTLIIEALGHNYHDEVTLPTCLNQGYTTHTCLLCGDSYIDNYVESLGHDYVITYEWSNDYSKIVAEAICSRCGDSITVEANSIITTVNATCHSEGYIKYIALFENELFEEQEIVQKLPKLSHVLGEAVVENLVSSTCLEEGHYDSVIYCEICHEEISREVVHVSKVDHSYTIEVVNPTCENQGYTIHTCEKCGHTYIDEYVSALGHDYHEEIVLPTCLDQGYTKHICDRCNDTYIDEYVNALGHDYIITYNWEGNSKVTATAVCSHNSNHVITETVTTSSKTTLPTCENAGKTIYTATFTNKVFNSVSKEVILSQLGHNYIYHEHVDATCEKDGMEAYYTCSVCGKVFDLNKNETTLDTLVIEALGHDYHEVVTLPTCENQGYTTHTCQVCNDSYIDNYVDALGHEYHEVVTLPTCESQGYTTHTCQVCNDSYIDNYVDALGHEYKISYEWNQDNSNVTAKARCIRCGNEIVEEVNTKSLVISLATCLDSGSLKFIATFENSLFSYQEKVVTIPAKGHDLVHHDGKDATCTIDGYKPYDSCECGYTTYEIIPKLGHTPSEKVVENKVLPTCENNGSYDEVVYCSRCGEELDRITIIIPKLGHSYISVVTKPTCENQGYTTHTCDLCGDSYIDNYVDALGHEYGMVTYTWNSDNTKVTATKVCLRCGEIYSEEGRIIETIKKESTCKEEGILLLVAYFENFDSDSKSLVIDKKQHNPMASEVVNEVLPTCLLDGHYNLVIRCMVCGEELSNTFITTPKLGHDYDYSNGVFIWDNYDSCRYVVTCKHDSSHHDTFNASITVEVIKEASDLETGIRLYTAKVNVNGEEYTDTLEEIIPTTSHIVKRVFEILPSCTEDGNIEYYYCSSCDKYYKDAKLEHEIRKEDVILEALGHDYISHQGHPCTCTEVGYESYQTCSRCNYSTYKEIPALGHHFEEYDITPTCTDGGYTLHICDNCGESYKDNYLSALGHDYVITYEWNNDYSSVTAKARCKRDLEHTIIETVNTKSYTLTLADCENDGSVKYIAVFENQLFESDSKVVVVNKNGHTLGDAVVENYKAPTCLEEGSHDLVYYCSTCGTMLKRTTVIDSALGHTMHHHEGVDATCTLDGYMPYDECLVCGYSTYETIKALGHKSGEVSHIVIEEATCLSTGSHYDITYCSVCGEQLSKVLVIDKALGHNYIDEEILPTCTTQGYTTHTCSLCGRSYQDNYLNALGHDYSIIQYEWNSNHTYCDAHAYCTHDHNHVIHEGVYTISKVVSLPTCEEDGVKVYTAEFTNIRFETQKYEELSKAKGHTYGDATYVFNEYNSIVTASRVCEVCGKIHSEISHTKSTCIEPTCLDEGLIIYTATFINEAYQTQTKEVIVEALGHDYGEVNYIWSNDHKTCTARRICSHDNNHLQQEISNSTNTVINPTCLDEGLITYYAMFENREFETQVDYVVIEALGHSFGEVSYVWSSDYKIVVARRVCNHDYNHIEEESVNTTSKVSKAPTCEETGVMTYTATFNNQAFNKQTFNVAIAKLGHDYDSWYLVSNPSMTDEGIIERKCNHDESHKERKSIPTLNEIDYTYDVVLGETGRLDGIGEYYGVFDGVEVIVEVVIPAHGYNYYYYNGSTLVAKYHGYYGDLVEKPEDLKSYVVNGYVYYFNGWDKEVPSVLHEDMKFYATYIIGAVIYEEAVIEIPNSLTIDPSYIIRVEKDYNENSIKNKTKILTNNDNYSDYNVSSLFNVSFEKDGNSIELDDVAITIRIKKEAIDSLDKGTKLFYFDSEGNVHEIKYTIDGDYVVFEMNSIGNIGFANDGFNWLWTVFIIQSVSIVLLAVVIVYRKKSRA